MIELTQSDPKNVVNELNLWCNSAADVAGAPILARRFGAVWNQERAHMIQYLNATTITIPTELKRAAVLNEIVRAFARRAFSLSVFATVYSNVPLQGTDKIEVPYFPLQAGASTDWNAANGYEFSGTSTQAVREITVDKRKYQALDFGSETFRRQPFLNLVALSTMNAEKLAYDAIVDILSVVTLANYGAAAKTVAEAAICADDVIDIAGACNEAHWPDAGRGLLVNTNVDTSLMKDDAYKLAVNAGGSEVLREGKLPTISGFKYSWIPSLPENSENLIGMATFMSAILCAFSPVKPADEVRQQLTAYEVAIDPTTGIAMNYRAWGSAQMDRGYRVIETAYGYAKGEAAAIKRICKP